MLNSWLPSMNHSTNSSTFNKKLAASQLAKKNQNCRDLWIRKLYGLVHQLNASSETVVNTENLDNTKNAPALDDRVLGYKNHRSRYEACFPEYSYTDGKPFVFKYKKGSKKTKSSEVTSSGAKKPACLPKQKILKCLTEFYDLVPTLRYAMPERLSRKQMLVLIQTRLHVYTN